MREAYLEKKCREFVKSKGGLFYKLTGSRGIPDRLIVLHGKTVFVELKRPGGVLSKAQKYEIKKLLDLGAIVWVIFNYASFVELVETNILCVKN